MAREVKTPLIYREEGDQFPQVKTRSRKDTHGLRRLREVVVPHCGRHELSRLL